MNHQEQQPIEPSPTVTAREPARSTTRLVPEAEVGAIKDRWDQIKMGFVDDPAASVRQADRLVGETLEVLSQSIARARGQLGGRVAEGSGASTEDLRRALHSYQAILERFLS